MNNIDDFFPNGFEALYKGREWDGDYFDAVSEYLEKELYEQF